MAKIAIVIGAGIAGLATARALAVRGHKVTVIERHAKAVGASIRNFGMIWPIGQPDGYLYERAIASKAIWKQVCNDAGIWYDPVGSLHLAYNNYEQHVIEEFCQLSPHRPLQILTATDAVLRSPAIVEKDLKAALFSADEMIVDPREAIAVIPVYLEKKYGASFIWNSGVTEIDHPKVWCGKIAYEADVIYVCSGAEFGVLYPEQYAALPVTTCKLQMMRMQSQNNNWRMGPALCGGLSLIHYKSFTASFSVDTLRRYYADTMPEYLELGIHVMVAQNESGQLTIGDSHEYGITHDPFDKIAINEMILQYLGRFAHFPQPNIQETWNGIYVKMTDGSTEVTLQPQSGVTIINALGGAGMTLSFGLCDGLIGSM